MPMIKKSIRCLSVRQAALNFSITWRTRNASSSAASRPIFFIYSFLDCEILLYTHDAGRGMSFYVIESFLTRFFTVLTRPLLLIRASWYLHNELKSYSTGCIEKKNFGTQRGVISYKPEIYRT